MTESELEFMVELYTTIFYPLNLKHVGYIYGWKLSRGTWCVAGVIQSDSREQAQTILKQSSITHDWKKLVTSTLMQPSLLGRCISATAFPGIILDSMPVDKWSFIFYRQPELSRMRFFSVEPLELDVTLLSTSATKGDLLSRRTRILCNSDFTKQLRFMNRPTPCLPIDHMNLAHDLSHILQRVATGHQNVALGTIWTNLFFSSSHTYFLDYPFLHFRRLANLCISLLYGICNFPAPSFPFDKTRLKDLSASIQQIDVRLEQATFLPQQFGVLQRRNPNNAAYFSAHYISFYNCIWLVLNDAIVGAAFGTFLYENSTQLGVLLHSYTSWLTVTLVRNALVWLDNWPAGLKLNTELSRFLCLCFMSFTDIWGRGLHLFAPYFPVMLRIIGLMGRLGMTMILSLLSDLLSVLTGHLYMSYLVATVVFSRQLSVAHSLWNLFRGKRHNVLRNRTDSWDYDIDQLLLGTILFTLVAFLLPTVLVYYALFALARLIIILLHATLETFLAFMNHFPLFAMMLRAKDPSRLPGGVYFDTSTSGAGKVVLRVRLSPIANATSTDVRIESSHLDLQDIFPAFIGVVKTLGPLSSIASVTLPGNGDPTHPNSSV